MKKASRKKFKRKYKNISFSPKKIKGSSKRLSSYENYVKRYLKAQESMRRRGSEMYAPMMTKAEYENYRKFLISIGITKNINQTIVSEQQYKYSRKTARRWKDTAIELDLEWDDSKIFELRTGKIDVSEINNKLKELYPDWNGYDRATFISNEVFGSP